MTGQRLSLMYAGPEERQAQAAELIAAVGFEPQWVGHVRYARNLEVCEGSLVRCHGAFHCSQRHWRAARTRSMRARGCSDTAAAPLLQCAQALAELYIHLGGGMGGADWGADDGTRPFHFQVLRRR